MYVHIFRIPHIYAIKITRHMAIDPHPLRMRNSANFLIATPLGVEDA